MSRVFSMAYLTACDATPPEAVRIADRLGYAHVGLRLLPNAPGAPQQNLIGQPEALRETVALLRDTGAASSTWRSSASTRASSRSTTGRCWMRARRLVRARCSWQATTRTQRALPTATRACASS